MSRCAGRHAKITSRYEGRHIRPGAPGPAALAGTAAKAVPASLMAGVAGSALVLSGTASAATAPAGLVHGDAADLAAVKTTALATSASRGRHADPAAVKTVLAASVRRGRHGAPHSVYTVVPGDTLSKISARFCGTEADYPSLAAASGISDPNVIYAGQAIKLRCHHRVPPAPAPAASAATAPAASASTTSDQAPAQPVQTSVASTGGMSAFEACVISRESGGNPAAVNPVSGAGGLFQFLPSTWAALGYASSYPGGAQTAPASVQEAAFAEEYAQAGTAPWAPYDGC
jgi:resuscitation-promoting factor RpfC